MSLGSLTAAVLMRAMVTLNHQMSPPQHALLCADERRSALQQLMVTTETAAKLAEVAHVEALAAQCKAADGGGGADRTTAETERLHAEWAKIGREVERVLAETERTRAETEKVGKETEKVCKEIQRAAQETLRLKVEAEAEAERAREEAAAAQETEEMDGEMGKGMGETEQQTPSTPPTVSRLREWGRISVLRNRTQLSPRRRCPSRSPPASMLPPDEAIRIVALYEDNEMVDEIEDALGEWNSNNREQFTLAGWAWFMHSETEAFVFLDRPGMGETYLNRMSRNRTGAIKLPMSFLNDLAVNCGYDGAILGKRDETGERDLVIFE